MFVIEPDTIDYEMTSQDDLTLFVDDLGALPQMKNEYIDWTRYEKRFEEASYNANKYQNALNHAWESLKNLTEDPIGTIINNSDFAVRQLQTEINREQRNVLRQANPTTIQANGSMSLNWTIYGNKLQFIVREPREEIKQAINNIYYRYGYTSDEYTSLTDNIINSRRYFNYIKGDINIATTVPLEKDRYISQDAITDVLERFKSGVTILHTLSSLTAPLPDDTDYTKVQVKAGSNIFSTLDIIKKVELVQGGADLEYDVEALRKAVAPTLTKYPKSENPTSISDYVYNASGSYYFSFSHDKTYFSGGSTIGVLFRNKNTKELEWQLDGAVDDASDYEYVLLVADFYINAWRYIIEPDLHDDIFILANLGPIEPFHI